MNIATLVNEEGDIAIFTRMLNKLLKMTRLQDSACDICLQLLILNIDLIPILVLPSLLQDIIDRADKWGDHGETGRIDPFNEVYDVSLFFETTYCSRVGVELSSFSSFLS